MHSALDLSNDPAQARDTPKPTHLGGWGSNRTRIREIIAFEKKLSRQWNPIEWGDGVDARARGT